MSKINNDHGSGYAFGADFSLSAFNAEQKQQRKKRIRDDEEMKACRQTFAVPFNTKCANCEHILVKGLHGYMNRYKARDPETKKPLDYLKIPIWDVAFKCPRCGHNIVYRTDFETPHITAGYHVVTNGKRMAGDFHELMSKAAAAEEARKIEEAKTAAVPEAERRGLENQRRKAEAERLARFMEGRKAATTTNGVQSLQDLLLNEVAAVPSSALSTSDDAFAAPSSLEEDAGAGGVDSLDAALARLRSELGIVVNGDGAVIDDLSGEAFEGDHESSDDNDGDYDHSPGAATTPAVTVSTAPSLIQNDLVDFFLSGAVASTFEPSNVAGCTPIKYTPGPASVPTQSSATTAPSLSTMSNDDFFAQFS